jgi:hypothetical protein
MAHLGVAHLHEISVPRPVETTDCHFKTLCEPKVNPIGRCAVPARLDGRQGGKADGENTKPKKKTR